MLLMNDTYHNLNQEGYGQGGNSQNLNNALIKKTAIVERPHFGKNICQNKIAHN